MRPSFRAPVGRPRGAGGGGSPCLSPPPCLPRAGAKAGPTGVAQSMEDVAPILPRLTSARRRPDAVRGMPLRAGAGLLACPGYRGSGQVADREARGVQAQWRPSPGAAAAQRAGPTLVRRGACGASVPWVGLRLSLGGGKGGRGGGSRLDSPLSPFGLPVLPTGGCGGLA